MTWVTDENNNRASVEYWGSEEAARESLKTLTDCSDCSDCSRCSRCFDCSRCSDCSCCSDCSDCSDCSRCSDCSCCSDCSDCSDCSPQKTTTAVPVIQDIHKAVLSAVESDGCKLDMGDWHRCETTHCRAGWVVHLAGKAGYELEEKTSTLFAAQQIYKASGYDISPCRFYDANEVAMADIKRLAEVQS